MAWQADDGSIHSTEADARAHNSRGGSFEGAVGGAAGAGLMWLFGLLAIGVFVATNILYAIVIGGIFIVGRGLNRFLKRIGIPLLLRLPVKLLTLVLVLAGVIWSIWDKNMGMVPALRNDAIVKTGGTLYGRLFPLNDDNTINYSVATLSPGDRITILGVTRNGSNFKVKTSSGIEGFIEGKNIENAGVYTFHKQGFWDRMMEFSFSPKENPLVPGRYETPGTDMVLILEKAKDKNFRAYKKDESVAATTGLKAGIKMLQDDNFGALWLYFDYTENQTPVRYKDGLYNFTFSIDLSSEEKQNSAAFAPYRRYMGEYVITSAASFAMDDIVWELIKQKDNSLFR